MQIKQFTTIKSIDDEVQNDVKTRQTFDFGMEPIITTLHLTCFLSFLWICLVVVAFRFEVEILEGGPL